MSNREQIDAPRQGGGNFWGVSPAQKLREKIKDYLWDDEEVLLADGFEKAFIGIGRQFSNPPVAVYDREKCIKALMKEGMNREEAEEFFSFNTQGAWVGPNTPMFVEVI